MHLAPPNKCKTYVGHLYIHYILYKEIMPQEKANKKERKQRKEIVFCENLKRNLMRIMYFVLFQYTWLGCLDSLYPAPLSRPDVRKSGSISFWRGCVIVLLLKGTTGGDQPSNLGNQLGGRQSVCFGWGNKIAEARDKKDSAMWDWDKREHACINDSCEDFQYEETSDCKLEGEELAVFLKGKKFRSEWKSWWYCQVGSSQLIRNSVPA